MGKSLLEGAGNISVQRVGWAWGEMRKDRSKEEREGVGRKGEREEGERGRRKKGEGRRGDRAGFKSLFVVCD